jgi:hemolysin III
MEELTAPVKPLLRGWLHVGGLIILLACSPILIVLAENGAELAWSLCFVGGVATMMLTSALFHRINWHPRARRAWRRADHSAIFAAIAGSYFGIAGITMHGTPRTILLVIVASGTVIGIAIRQLALDTPKWVATLPYLVVGWAAVAFIPQMYRGGGLAFLLFVLGGGLAYTIGAIFYGSKRPKLWPGVFGYHELFHALTLVGASLHFTAIAIALR